MSKKKKKPNFLIPDASRSGTTTLHFYLKQHPDIFMPKKKELRFFDRNENYKKGISYYKNKFKKHDKEKAIGESSPPYFYKGISFDKNRNYRWNIQDDPPQRIHDKLPNVKLIFTLRNPITRSYSQYWKNLRQGREKKYSFKKAIKEEYTGNRSPENSPMCWIYKNSYATHLKKWYSIFEEEQVKIIIFEKWINNTKSTLKEICNFLEVDSEFEFNEIDKKKNKAKTPRSIKINDWYHEYFKNSFLGRIIKKINLRPGYPKMNKKTKSYATKIFKPKIKKLEEIIDKDLSSWINNTKHETT
ncbi:MAG: sulfotransferase [Candidatus Paceibacteria bacterium]